MGVSIFSAKSFCDKFLIVLYCCKVKYDQSVAYDGARLGMILGFFGGAFVTTALVCATKNADEYAHIGGGKALIESFIKSFGEIFDGSIHTTTDFLQGGKVTIGGIDFEIVENDEAFDIVIPEINAVYIHMLGHDCHSIVAGQVHADAIIANLNDFLVKGYDLVLTSHYTPEDLKDVKIKIAYLEELKKIANSCKTAEEFKEKVNKKYPKYSGQNYLDMTAGYFFA